jgi:type III secretion system PrgH/EprH family protein
MPQITESFEGAPIAELNAAPTALPNATQNAPTAVLRLLNGALRGGEFVLEAGTTLFVVSVPDALHREVGQPEFPENAIFVPVDEGGGNFEVEVGHDQDGMLQIDIRDLRAPEEASAYVANTVRRIDGLAIALRSPQHAWSTEVLIYTGQTAALPAPLEAAAPLSGQNARGKGPRRRGRAAGLALLSMTLAAAVAVMWWSQNTTQVGMGLKEAAQKLQTEQRAQSDELSTLLAGAVGRYRVLPGRDGLVYIFTSDERDAAWARQAIARSSYAARSRIVLKSAEHARIAQMLGGVERSLAYHILRLDNPARPELWLSQERAPLDASARKALAQRMTVLLPYAEAVGVEFLADETVARQAAAGLDQLGVPYRKIVNDGSVTLSVNGQLADGELQKIRTFVEAFYRQWGTRYIYFSVEMEDDLRKGKSFEYGGGGYVKSGASHWDFSG